MGVETGEGSISDLSDALIEGTITPEGEMLIIGLLLGKDPEEIFENFDENGKIKQE